MEARKRKQIPGKNNNKSVCGNVETQNENIFTATSINHQRKTLNFCPRCAGNSFEDLQGVLETGLCVECEHEKVDWLIAKREAQIEARKHRKPVALKRRFRGRQQIL